MSHISTHVLFENKADGSRVTENGPAVRSITVSPLFCGTGHGEIPKLRKDAARMSRCFPQISSVTWCNVK